MLSFVLWYGLLFLSIVGDIFLYMRGFQTAAIIVSIIIGILVGIYIGITMFLRMICGSNNKTFWI